MPFNYSYSPSDSEADLSALAVGDTTVNHPDGSNHQQCYSNIINNDSPGSRSGAINNNNNSTNQNLNTSSREDATNGIQGRYQSLGKTTCLVELGSSATINTVSNKVSKDEESVSQQSLPAWSSVQNLKSSKEPGEEGMFLTFLQVFGPFLIAGLGSMGTGILLDVVKDWSNFKNIDSLITLVPTLLGLKGNLEMTVTARLCTASNLGILDDTKVLLRFLRDDLLLTQFQATIVSLLASILTILIQGIRDPSQITYANCVVVISSAVVTAAIACLFLGCLMTLVVFISRKIRINPDNVCAPLAASLGDISTLGIFAYTSYYLYLLRSHLYIPILLAITFMCLCPMWGRLAWQSPEVRVHLQHGWLPILLAMCISLGAGYILDIASKDLEVAAAFVPVVSGICGNLLVILVCRMTTVLRRQVRLGEGRQLISDIRNDHPLWCGGKPSALKSTFRVLAGLPFSHIIFSFVIAYFTNGVTATWVFMAVFLSLVFLHGMIMLLLTRETVLRLWLWGIDPDVASIPILTAVADLTGGAFTCIIFVILYTLHDSSLAAAAGNRAALSSTIGTNSTMLTH